MGSEETEVRRASCKNDSSIIGVSRGPLSRRFRLPPEFPAPPRHREGQAGAALAGGQALKKRPRVFFQQGNYAWRSIAAPNPKAYAASGRGGKFREPKFSGRGWRDESRLEPVFVQEAQKSEADRISHGVAQKRAEPSRPR